MLTDLILATDMIGGVRGEDRRSRLAGVRCRVRGRHAGLRGREAGAGRGQGVVLAASDALFDAGAAAAGKHFYLLVALAVLGHQFFIATLD